VGLGIRDQLTLYVHAHIGTVLDNALPRDHPTLLSGDEVRPAILFENVIVQAHLSVVSLTLGPFYGAGWIGRDYLLFEIFWCVCKQRMSLGDGFISSLLEVSFVEILPVFRGHLAGHFRIAGDELDLEFVIVGFRSRFSPGLVFVQNGFGNLRVGIRKSGHLRMIFN